MQTHREQKINNFRNLKFPKIREHQSRFGTAQNTRYPRWKFNPKYYLHSKETMEILKCLSKHQNFSQISKNLLHSLCFSAEGKRVRSTLLSWSSRTAQFQHTEQLTLALWERPLPMSRSIALFTQGWQTISTLILVHLKLLRITKSQHSKCIFKLHRWYSSTFHLHISKNCEHQSSFGTPQNTRYPRWKFNPKYYLHSK